MTECPNCDQANPPETRITKGNTRYIYCTDCIKENQDEFDKLRGVVKKLYHSTESEIASRQLSKLAMKLDTMKLQPIRTRRIGTGGRPI